MRFSIYIYIYKQDYNLYLIIVLSRLVQNYTLASQTVCMSVYPYVKLVISRCNLEYLYISIFSATPKVDWAIGKNTGTDVSMIPYKVLGTAFNVTSAYLSESAFDNLVSVPHVRRRWSHDVSCAVYWFSREWNHLPSWESETVQCSCWTPLNNSALFQQPSFCSLEHFRSRIHK